VGARDHFTPGWLAHLGPTGLLFLRSSGTSGGGRALRRPTLGVRVRPRGRADGGLRARAPPILPAPRPAGLPRDHPLRSRRRRRARLSGASAFSKRASADSAKDSPAPHPRTSSGRESRPPRRTRRRRPHPRRTTCAGGSRR
jgi:hypothetical protein